MYLTQQPGSSLSKQYRRSYAVRTSKLAPELHTIMKMHRAGDSLETIRFYLANLSPHKITCTRSTIKRYIDKVNADAKARDEFDALFE